MNFKENIKVPVDPGQLSRYGNVCGTFGGQETCVQGFGGGDLRERDYLIDL